MRSISDYLKACLAAAMGDTKLLDEYWAKHHQEGKEVDLRSMDTNQNYLWSLVDDELTIEMQHPEFYTIDMLPGILSEIISAIYLPTAEKIRHIRIGVIGG